MHSGAARRTSKGMNVHTRNAAAELIQAEALRPLGPRSYHGVNWMGLKTLYLKEVKRFWKVKTQTVGARALHRHHEHQEIE